MRYFKIKWVDPISGDGFVWHEGESIYFNVEHLSIKEIEDMEEIGVIRGIIIDNQIMLER
jgi:hypothetical protein